MTLDYLIIGQGLAGSAIAMALLDKGASIAVIDREDQHSASRVAAGLVTTLAGKGMNPGWRQAEYLPEAMRYYAELEQRSGKKLYHPADILKIFENQKQQRKFNNKKDDLPYWSAPANLTDLTQWNAPDGGFIMTQGGWLDTHAYLDTVREILDDSYQKNDFDEQLLHVSSDSIQYKDIEAKAIILCQGIAGLTHGMFSFLNHRSAKGEMLRIKITNKPEHQVISLNGWLVPLGNQEYKAGATYEWSDMQGKTTDAGRAEVERKLANILGENHPYKVLDHQAGVRPIIRKSQPLIGTHPDHPSVKFFNALGSKGVITAPSTAKHFAEHLVDGVALDSELDLSNFLSLPPATNTIQSY